METNESAYKLLDLMICPGFSVKDSKIDYVNDYARRLFLSPGMDILPLLVTGQQEYADLKEGCLWLSMTIAGETQGVTVTRLPDMDIFIANEQEELRELQVLSLAAQELRMPLSNVVFSADRLGDLQSSDEATESAARLNRGTAQLQRLICNMSDALQFVKGGRLQLKNITSLLSELSQKAADLAMEAGITLSYQGPDTDIFTMMDPAQLERAFYNLVSNAMKFTPKGGKIDVQLSKKGKQLLLTVQDNGSGIGDNILSSVFTRYLREPSLEDSRYGLGLGMVLVRAAARTHGGTVLIDRMDCGTRITLTMAIRENRETMVHSPILTVDYAGERDHGLLELSESLPHTLYTPEQK